MNAGLFDLSGKLALVTGAGSGLGLEFSRGFAASGAEVICADRDSSRAEEAAALIQKAGGRATPIRVDVADSASVQSLADRLRSSHGHMDVLVNNAGVSSLPNRVHELPIEEWDRLIAINLRGVFLCTRAILPMMLSRGGGSIINIASIIGIVGFYPDAPLVTANYAAAKAGVIGFTRQLALEYAKDNIRANAIAPGFHKGTRLGDATKATLTPAGIAEREARIVGATPMGRRGLPEELLGLAIYLASDASRYLTGQVIAHDGGWTAA
jgi:NAD(P)-dependent dehydrogenase (short-subunit alcohol dehydrogenase family)